MNETMIRKKTLINWLNNIMDQQLDEFEKANANREDWGRKQAEYFYTRLTFLHTIIEELEEGELDERNILEEKRCHRQDSIL